MSEAGFLSAIRADPNDASTRLIYADYLEERDDPRGEFLRVEARLAEPGLEYAEFDQLRERAKQLRAILYGKHRRWLVPVDGPDRFTLLWTNADCYRLREANGIGKPLAFASVPSWSQFKPRPGIHVYAIRINQKKLYVVGRMQVAEIMTREAYLQAHPDHAVLMSPFDGAVLVAERGTPFRPDTVVPHNMLQRFRYRSGDREYPLKHVKYGELTKATAQDFDFLLTGQGARRLSV
jgi:uncharacterized protein (TIGR02996 family)